MPLLSKEEWKREGRKEGKEDRGEGKEGKERGILALLVSLPLRPLKWNCSPKRKEVRRQSNKEGMG